MPLILSEPPQTKQLVKALTVPYKPSIIYDLSSDFDVVYESPNGDQTVSMEYDNPDSGVSLDRTDYPQNTGVVITIDDQALNVDPTSEDKWTFGTGDRQFYGVAVDTGNTFTDQQNDRDTDISNARTIMNGEIREARDYDSAEDVKEALDEEIEEADETISRTTANPTERLRLVLLYGWGDRDANDSQVTSTTNATSGDVSLDSDADNYINENYKGQKLIQYELDYGDKDAERGSNAYKGALLANEEKVAGVGLMTSNILGNEHYKGTALLKFQWVDGIEPRTVTPANVLPDLYTTGEVFDEDVNENNEPDGVPDNGVPEDYRGTAWIDYDTATADATVTGTQLVPVLNHLTLMMHATNSNVQTTTTAVSTLTIPFG